MAGVVEKAVRMFAQSGITPIIKGRKIHYDTDETPGGSWLYIKYSDHNCTFLKSFIFGSVRAILPESQHFIPTECMNCYKVVARPETFYDFMRLKRIMKKMGLPSKCGIEQRVSVDALYGGYWYCNSLSEGKERLEQIREALAGTDIPFFLKRACTEYEQIFGPSDTWRITKEHEKIEQEFLSRVSVDNTKRPQDVAARKEIYKRWKDWAKEVGPDYVGTYNYVTYGGGNGHEKRFKGSEKEI